MTLVIFMYGPRNMAIKISAQLSYRDTCIFSSLQLTKSLMGPFLSYTTKTTVRKKVKILTKIFWKRLHMLYSTLRMHLSRLIDLSTQKRNLKSFPCRILLKIIYSMHCPASLQIFSPLVIISVTFMKGKANGTASYLLSFIKSLFVNANRQREQFLYFAHKYRF